MHWLICSQDELVDLYAKCGEAHEAWIMVNGGKHPDIGGSLVTMYAKCDALIKSQEVFDGKWVRNVVIWNALLAGYVQHGHNEEALNCVRWMQQEALSPNAVTFVSILKAFGSHGLIIEGKKIMRRL